MIEEQELALLQAVADLLKEYAPAKALSQIVERISDLDSRVKEIPAGQKGDPGERGQDGNSIDQAVVVAEVLRQIPAPKNGTDGASVDMFAVRELVATEVQKAFAALPPAKDGLPGKDAEPIHPDTVALMVVREVEKQVAAIPKAQDGTAGRDAIQIEILSAIDAARSYPRGTHALYKNGEIRARTNTTPLTGSLEESGWEVVREGVADVLAEQDPNLRTFRFAFVHTSGATKQFTFSIPTVIHRGVWTEGTEYLRGDTVTREGAMWHCNVDKTRVLPGTPNASDWTLCVKRGAEGKSIKGDKGDPGKDGRDGKDLTQMDPSGRKW